MQAILADRQFSMRAQVFQVEKLQIPPARIEMPPQLSLNWEVVYKQSPEGAYFPEEEFLKNINNFKDNRFIDIGKTKKIIKVKETF